MKLFRLMKIDADGKPVVGHGSMMLGIRPVDPMQPEKRADVKAILGSDPVLPGEGGLSCYSDPASISLRAKKVVLWSVESDHLPEGIQVQDAGSPHFHLEPEHEMSLDHFQLLLQTTRDEWQQENGGPQQ